MIMRPYAYGPGVSFGFGGGPRFGVWFYRRDKDARPA